MKKLIIATRASKLALWQANHIKNKLLNLNSSIQIEVKTFVTRGDVIQDKPLAFIGGKGVFTKEIDEAILRNDAHIAVHSMKDLPIVLPKKLKLCAITKREDVRDALLSQNFNGLQQLPIGATVGSTSLRRRMNLYAQRSDLKIVQLRGNVNTRIEKLKNGEFDAIILATAGINRLRLTNSVKYFSPIDIKFCIPAMGQGALALQTIDDFFVMNLVSKLNDKKSMIEVTIERDFVATLEGGCQVPIGINAQMLASGDILVNCIIGLPNGKDIIKQTKIIKEKDYKTAGIMLAKEMIKKGAKEVLANASEMAYKEYESNL